MSNVRKNDVKRVISVNVEVGEFTMIVPHYLSYCYDIIKESHPELKGSVMVVTRVPGQVTCNACGTLPAVRSLSREENESYLNDSGLQLKTDKERRITPCEAHYKLIKKKKKGDDKIKKSRFSAQNAPRIGKQVGKRIQDM